MTVELAESNEHAVLALQSRSGRFGGQAIAYDVAVQEFLVKGPDEASAARYVCTSYIRTDADADATQSRPVVFAFNGGPGSASLWLHMGLGPRRPADADSLSPKTTAPFFLTDNHDCPLDAMDLVFVDPPGTGFSRLLDFEHGAGFHSTGGDALGTVEMINAWRRLHRRWNSPVYLLGESYGAVRAAAMARISVGGPLLTGRLAPLPLSGIILMGAVLTPPTAAGPDTEAAALLPTLAATAHYHGRTADQSITIDEHLEAAEAFAAGEYVQALFAGSRLDGRARARVAARMHELIGLPTELLAERGFRVPASEFTRLLLADQRLQVGLYDSRYRLPLSTTANDPVGDDPAMGQYSPMFAATVLTYFHEELGLPTDREYRNIEFRQVNARWDYGAGPGVAPATNRLDDLATAMRRSPGLRVLFCQGNYDLVTTTGRVRYDLSHADLGPSRVRLNQYESGHMPYLGAESRRMLVKDIRAFVTC